MDKDVGTKDKSAVGEWLEKIEEQVNPEPTWSDLIALAQAIEADLEALRGETVSDMDDLKAQLVKLLLTAPHGKEEL